MEKPPWNSKTKRRARHARLKPPKHRDALAQQPAGVMLAHAREERLTAACLD